MPYLPEEVTMPTPDWRDAVTMIAMIVLWLVFVWMT